jgi:hypothetical protein
MPDEPDSLRPLLVGGDRRSIARSNEALARLREDPTRIGLPSMHWTMRKSSRRKGPWTSKTGRRSRHGTNNRLFVTHGNGIPFLHFR